MIIRRIMRGIGLSLMLLFIFISCMCAFGVRWMFATWPNLQMDELIYTLSTLSGTGGNMISKFISGCLVPAAAVFLLAAAIIFIIRKKKPARRRRLTAVALLGCVAVLCISGWIVWDRLDIAEYAENASTPSSYIEDNYVDPDDVDLVFPAKKRNLIYIFLESAEVTFADVESGGAFSQNVIPELTDIAMEYEDFSGDSQQLNGANVMSGCSWTMGAMFAHTSGLPLKISIGQNEMRYQDSFFSGITTMGDILEDAGYNQTLLVGSDATFGGRELYFTEHGNFKICDYQYAADNGYIPPNYYVWWGYEDFYLFEIAKIELAELAAQGEPFNLTMLTVDTHFEDGHLCSYCSDGFGDQYSNVYACSSCQVSQFVEWAQQQPFYENTTIVIVGDHLTMDVDYCNKIPGDYTRRVYTAYLNSAAEPVTGQRRFYTTFDLFPTTLAALGVEIPGDRLGLGANLFSSTDTLLERDGLITMNVELQKKSEFMESAANIQINSSATVNIDYIDEGPFADISVRDIADVNEHIASVRIVIRGDGTASHSCELTRQGDGSYFARMDVSFLKDRNVRAEIVAVGESGARYGLDSIDGDLALCRRADMDEYLAELSRLEHHTVFIVARDDSSRKLTDSNKAHLRAMGLELVDLVYPNSYYAVISPEGIAENVSSVAALSYAGTLPGEKEFSLRSAAFPFGNSCSIMIDGVEYSTDTTGMNIVVYDNLAGRVVDSTTYNVSTGVPTIASFSRFALADSEIALEYLHETESLVISVTGIEGISKSVKSVGVELWTGTREKRFVTLDHSFGRYYATIDVSDFYGGDICINVNAFTSNTQYRIGFESGELIKWIAGSSR